MIITEYTGKALPKTEKSRAVALGCFDGVHIGHRALITKLVEESNKTDLVPCVITFAGDLPKSKELQSIIYNIEDISKIFSQLGVKETIVIDFGYISNLSAEQFVTDILINKLDAKLAVCGYNFRFGKKRCADAKALARLMSSLGADTIVIPEQSNDGIPISSTRIRELLASGDVGKARILLGEPYHIHGIVEKGLGIGKIYGFPTINTSIGGKTPLRTGVYRTAVRIGERLYTGITNIGSCPTVKERELHAETLIADFDGDLYGEDIYIYFLGYLREEKRFSTIEQLKEQIFIDKNISVKENGDLKWLEIGPNSQ